MIAGGTEIFREAISQQFDKKNGEV